MWVTSDPLASLSFPLDQATMIRATSSRGVQVDLGKEELTKSGRGEISESAHWSASGMNFRFMGVSRVMGRMAAVKVASGSPDLSGSARDLTRW